MTRQKHAPFKRIAGSKNIRRTIGSKMSKKPLVDGGGGNGKRRKSRPGTVALREIRRYQKETKLIIPREPFFRLVRQITGNLNTGADVRFRRSCIEAFREASESYLVSLMSDSYNVSIHCNRKTLMGRDMRLAHQLIESNR